MEEGNFKKFARLFFTEKDNKTPCDVRIYGFIVFLFITAAAGWFVYKEKVSLQDIVNAFSTLIGIIVGGVWGKNKGEGPADKDQQ